MEGQAALLLHSETRCSLAGGTGAKHTQGHCASLIHAVHAAIRYHPVTLPSPRRRAPCYTQPSNYDPASTTMASISLHLPHTILDVPSTASPTLHFHSSIHTCHCAFPSATQHHPSSVHPPPCHTSSQAPFKHPPPCQPFTLPPTQLY